MAHLHVCVRYQGMVVEDRVCPVYDGMRLGEAPTAEVAFPGVDISVRKAGDRLLIRGRWVNAGEQVYLHLGAVQVVLEHQASRTIPRDFGLQGDLRILVATMAMVLGGMWWDSVDQFVQTDPVASELMAGLSERLSAPAVATEQVETRRARIEAPQRLGQSEPEPTPEVIEDPVPELQFICASEPTDADTGLEPSERVCVAEVRNGPAGGG